MQFGVTLQQTDREGDAHSVCLSKKCRHTHIPPPYHLTMTTAGEEEEVEEKEDEEEERMEKGREEYGQRSVAGGSRHHQSPSVQHTHTHTYTCTFSRDTHTDSMWIIQKSKTH